MCGRYALSVPADVIADFFGLGNLPTWKPALVLPRYNVAPTQRMPVLRDTGAGRELSAGAWGLPGPKGRPLINARSESVFGRRSFADSALHRRCLVPADGYYEWRQDPSGKQAMLMRLATGGLFAMAGLWEPDSSGGDPRFCVLTAAANRRLAHIHDRMPVLVEPRDFDLWLDPSCADSARLAPLLVPAPDDWLRADPVSDRVNKVSHDDPACMEPTPSAEVGSSQVVLEFS